MGVRELLTGAGPGLFGGVERVRHSEVDFTGCPSRGRLPPGTAAAGGEARPGAGGIREAVSRAGFGRWHQGCAVSRFRMRGIRGARFGMRGAGALLAMPVPVPDLGDFRGLVGGAPRRWLGATFKR
ncbi:hypothetical protein SAV14893_035170 [Streptomyces avermitilis]|uniref:Uncharacterized protein n=1 Tax=Streptomyces avermitilis TaxID=33903 RepID=A0A4D4LUF3_STRAX|nr:hypothetical protein SAVMC3_47190 [Streptomyces avermitilis]GDY64124.1 hypothetical protein SAV14893_035170 [Streptomyces avermitilis]GDY84691.1 hypothetical protein SAVCW2_38900 [Streptomyces avermitilis]